MNTVKPSPLYNLHLQTSFGTAYASGGSHVTVFCGSGRFLALRALRAALAGSGWQSAGVLLVPGSCSVSFFVAPSSASIFGSPAYASLVSAGAVGRVTFRRW